ncbi:MAG TPA: N-acetyl-alpha-D-glucosaminyl L-malate synthase BshA [Terracidiphilus sp.]|nr:N-acetyl-alpha-D-glucosaminyl L-malate synthase BshA [Terracidiphilus sp.]
MGARPFYGRHDKTKEEEETERHRLMRIGITCYPTYGGSGVVATELGIELAAAGHEVHFISYSQPFRLSGRDDGIFYHEVPVSSYPLFEFPPYDLALASRMAEVAEFNNLDLLHVHYAIPHSVSAMLARQMLAARGRRLPFVTTLHGTDITLVGLDRSYLPITRFSIQESDGVTSISQYLKEKTVSDFEITRPIEVIPNFVNCDVYTPYTDEAVRSEARKRFARPDESILMHLSNFRPVKRVVDAVKVFARVAQQLPAQLVLVGDGPDRSAAEWLVHELGINDKVHFLGKQDRVNELLPLADLMLMPSQLESFGLAALEAMACRVPAIATRVGGVPELIDDGVSGLLYAVGAIEQMADGAIALLKDRDRLDVMRDAARRTARTRFCATLVLPLYVKYYEQVLAAR